MGQSDGAAVLSVLPQLRCEDGRGERIMAFVILCDRCGAIIRPGKSSYASVSCTMNGKMDAFLICERCAGELKHWITGDELEDDE